jgi:drug/metabolite transporter (DMT)-like permease
MVDVNAARCGPDSTRDSGAGAVGAGSHLMLVRAYETANASTLAPFTYSHTVAALGTGWLVFGTFPDGWALAGMALIVATGTAMAVFRR